MSTGLKFKKSLAKTGNINIQAQPKVANLEITPKIQGTNPIVVKGKIVTNLNDPLKNGGLAPPGGIFYKNIPTTIPPFFNKITYVSPSPGILISPIPAYFSPIRLNGISEQRPEIIALSDYSPVFRGEYGNDFSDVGDFISTSIAARKLRLENIKNLILSLQETEDAKDIIQELSARYAEEIDDARKTVSFMTSIDQRVRNLRDSLNIRKDNILTDSPAGNNTVKARSYREFLVEEFGFSNEGYDNFSNTKIWQQFLFDSKQVLGQYSPSLFGTDKSTDPNKQLANQNLKIKSNNQFQNFQNFGIVKGSFVGGSGNPVGQNTNNTPSRNEDQDFSNINNELLDITDGQFRFDIGLFTNVDEAFVGNNFFQFLDLLPSSPEDRIKLLTFVLSKEANISRGLGDTKSSEIISSIFNGSATGNPYDVIFGTPGEKISSNIVGESSLSSLGRYVDDENRIVLPFENVYVRDDSLAVYYPGTKILVDEILQGDEPFVFSNLDSYQSRFGDITRNAITAIKNLNAKKIKVNKSTRNLRPTRFFEKVVNDFVSAGDVLLTSKPVSTETVRNFSGPWAEFAFVKSATSNKQLKSLLFQLFLAVGLLGKPDSQNFGNNTRTSFFDRIGADLSKYGDFPVVQANNAIISNDLRSILNQTASGNDPTNLSNTANTTAASVADLDTSDTTAAYTVVALAIDAFLASLDNTFHSSQNFDDNVSVEEIFKHFTDPSNLIILDKIVDFLENIEQTASKYMRENKTRFNAVNRTALAAFAFELYLSFAEQYFDGISECEFANAQIENIKFRADTDRIQAVNGVLRLSLIDGGEFFLAGLDPSDPIITIVAVRESIKREDDLTDEIINRLERTFDRINTSYNQVKSFFRPNGPNQAKLQSLLTGDGNEGIERVAALNEGQFVLARKALDDFETGEGLAILAKNPLKKSNPNTSIPNDKFLIGTIDIKSIIPMKSAQQPNPVTYPAFLDRSAISENEVTLMRLIFNFPQFRSKLGSNLKILTVGIPSGFSQNFQTEVSVNTDDFDDIAEKQRDVVKIDVYRKSVIYEDLVFKPRSYFFELSRFVSRASLSSIDLPPVFNPQVAADLGILFMKDFSRRARGTDSNLSSFFLNPDYSFLSNEEKVGLIYNHMVDYALELYLKLLTGISTDETDYLINRDLMRGKIDLEQKNKFNDLILAYIRGVTGQPLTLEQLKQSSPQIRALLEKIDNFRLETNFTEQISPPTLPGVSRSAAVEITEDLINFLKVYSPKSLLTGGQSQKKRITSPKLFERIFNLAVDPDDFEIDITATDSTTSGSKTRSRLLANNLIVVENGIEKLVQTNPLSEISFDEFFVTIGNTGDN